MRGRCSVCDEGKKAGSSVSNRCRSDWERPVLQLSALLRASWEMPPGDRPSESPWGSQHCRYSFTRKGKTFPSEDARPNKPVPFFLSRPAAHSTPGRVAQEPKDKGSSAGQMPVSEGGQDNRASLIVKCYYFYFVLTEGLLN